MATEPQEQPSLGQLRLRYREAIETNDADLADFRASQDPTGRGPYLNQEQYLLRQQYLLHCEYEQQVGRAFLDALDQQDQALERLRAELALDPPKLLLVFAEDDPLRPVVSEIVEAATAVLELWEGEHRQDEAEASV